MQRLKMNATSQNECNIAKRMQHLKMNAMSQNECIVSKLAQSLKINKLVAESSNEFCHHRRMLSQP